MHFRQIHLDFHTGAHIPDIGCHFDGETFAQAFKDSYVDSVTIFAKCHHGHTYHPTEIGQIHPNLNFDLVRAQLDALHNVGIKAPIYISAGWDELAAAQHPEWCVIDPESKDITYTNETIIRWVNMDFSTPYLDYLCTQVAEVMVRYPDADGIFMDICIQDESISEHAKKFMDEHGLDYTKKADLKKFQLKMTQKFYDSIRATVEKYDTNMPLFFNSGHVPRGAHDLYKNFTHLELESLPTGGWGYEHFPISARYFDQLDLPYLGMTGKFNIVWGEIGGYKKPQALIYECANMLANGARCSVGDHLHPTGMIDNSTMDIIKGAYQWVAEREPWAVDTVNRADIAVLSHESIDPYAANFRSDEGQYDQYVVTALLENQLTFDLVDSTSNFNSYKMLILADGIFVDDALKKKIDKFAAGGGKVLFTGTSALNRQKGLAFDVGAKWIGTSKNITGDYILPQLEYRASFVNNPLFIPHPAEKIEITDGESLGEIYEPYFQRTVNRFSGHVNTPPKTEPSSYAVGSKKGNFTYFAFPIFTCYEKTGSLAMLEIARKLIVNTLEDAPLIECKLPHAGRVTVRHQPSHNRDIIYLLYATPIARGRHMGKVIQPIHDAVPLHNTTVKLQVDKPVKSVSIIPAKQAIDFIQEDGYITFTLDEFTLCETIEVQY